MAYSVGVINNVNNVANVNPKIMVAAIPPGLVLDTVASMMAV